MKCRLRAPSAAPATRNDVLSDVFFAVLKLAYKANEAKDTTPFCWYGICATTYIAAMLASNKALQWVNYPTQVSIS